MSDDLLPDRSDDDLIAEVMTVGLPAQYSSRITVCLAERLLAARNEIERLKARIEYLENGRPPYALFNSALDEQKLELLGWEKIGVVTVINKEKP